MKIFSYFSITSMVAFIGCNPENKMPGTNKAEITVPQKTITFADFKKIKGVDNVQDVPFQLYTKLDSIHFFVAPDKTAAHLKIAYHKLDHYCGFEEFDDFYSIHYSINNNISNSIEAFVLKSEFMAAFDLTLKGVNLYGIRSSTFRNSDDFENKSFNKYGTIVEVTEQEFKTASKNRIDEILVKNPHVKLKNNKWIYTTDAKETVVMQHKNVSTEVGFLSNEYIGGSPSLNVEVFKENSEDTPGSYYSFYNVKSLASLDLFAGGYPQILPNKHRISYITSNNDTGSDFVIGQYSEQDYTQENLLYVNFTNFKVADEAKAFWADNETFYVEVYPTTSAPSMGRKQKLSFIKITLKVNLF